MNFDYSKIINFLCKKDINDFNDILKEVIEKYFVMLKVNTSNRMILLRDKESDFKFILVYKNNRILIYPDTYSALSFGDDFKRIVEIKLNSNNDVVLSYIFTIDKPKGIVAVTSTWHYEDKMYTEVVSRVMFFKEEKIIALDNKESIQSFLNLYYEKRDEVFGDLYWDMDKLRKNLFVEPDLMMRIQINDGFKKEEFKNLFIKHNEKISEVINKNCKSSLF